MKLSQGDILVPPAPGDYKLRVRSLYFPKKGDPDPSYRLQLFIQPLFPKTETEKRWMDKRYDTIARWSQLQERGFILEKKQPQQLSLFASQGCSD